MKNREINQSIVRYTKKLILFTILMLYVTSCYWGANRTQDVEIKKDEQLASLAPFSYVPPAPPLPKMNIPMNNEVVAELKKLTTTERRCIEKAMVHKRGYKDTLDAILLGEGVPSELLALAIVESGLDYRVRSPAGAVGMWQFMRASAREHGLRVDQFEDQRRDPLMSTVAAARMLRTLHEKLNNWEMVLAAYNCGYGCALKQMKNGGSSNFWELSRTGHFNRETRRFVPRVMATAAIIRDLQKYGFKESK